MSLPPPKARRQANATRSADIDKLLATMPRPEQSLATYTFWVLVLYAPIETWASWPELYSPYYLVDLILRVVTRIARTV